MQTYQRKSLIFAFAGAGVPLPAAFVLAIGAAGLLGVLLDRVAFAPLRRRNAGTLVPLISSIGAAIVIQGVVRGVYGPDERRFGASLVPAATFHAGGLTFGTLDLTILIVSLGLMLLLSFVMRRTALGRNIRAAEWLARSSIMDGVSIHDLHREDPT